jgi:carbonic anhydrase
MVSAITFATTMILSGGTEPKVSAGDAFALLREGNLRFVAGHTEHPNQGSDRRFETSKGQSPFAVVLTCADSRLSPEIIFDRGLGDLFVLRVAGNVADPDIIASIEYAVEHLGSSLVVVLGHEKCGAVKAALDASGGGASHAHQPFFTEKKHGHAASKTVATKHTAPKQLELASFLPGLIKEISPCIKQTASWTGDRLHNCVTMNVMNTVNHVAEASPLKKLVKSHKVTVVGSIYDLESGMVKNFYEFGAKKAHCEHCGK